MLMRQNTSLEQFGTKEETPPSEAEMAYLQTQKTLKEAQSEQKILKERLKTLEARNKPAKWGQPVIIQSFEATRGHKDISNTSPEQLLQELKTAQHMLDSAKRATETARQELRDLQEEIETFKVNSAEETENMLQMNALHHKIETQTEQKQFHVMQTTWGDEKSKLLSVAEQMSLVSHDALHKASLMRESVEAQRKKIQSLAAEFRNDLSRAKALRELLDDQKMKVALIDNLIIEIDANKRNADNQLNQINEQKMLLRAVRVSQQAKAKLDDLAGQSDELRKAFETAEIQLAEAKEDRINSEALEAKLKIEMQESEAEFKRKQMSVFVLEAEIRELKAEINRLRPKAIEEGRKNVQLSHTFKQKRMDATQRFVSLHGADVYEAERVQHFIRNVASSLEATAPLPPLAPVGQVEGESKPGSSLGKKFEENQLVKSEGQKSVVFKDGKAVQRHRVGKKRVVKHDDDPAPPQPPSSPNSVKSNASSNEEGGN